MSVVIANFCSVYNKEAELDTFLSYNDIDILLGTESHLDTSIFNSEIFPDFYNIYTERIETDVFIMVKDNFQLQKSFQSHHWKLFGLKCILEAKMIS